MKALTVRQPWAQAIIDGHKSIENRSSGTGYRGPLAIHAGAQPSRLGRTDPRIRTAYWCVEDIDTFPLGYLLGVVELVDVHEADGCCEPWGEARYRKADDTVTDLVFHWVLAKPRAFAEPMSQSGRLGLWTLNPEIPVRDLLLPEVA